MELIKHWIKNIALQCAGFALHMLTLDWSKPWWSIGSWDCSYVQDRQIQVWIYCSQLDSEVCNGLITLEISQECITIDPSWISFWTSMFTSSYLLLLLNTMDFDVWIMIILNSVIFIICEMKLCGRKPIFIWSWDVTIYYYYYFVK